MINYERKAKLLSSGLCNKVARFDKEHQYQEGLDIVAFNDNKRFDEMILCNENRCSFADIEEARRINESNYHRVKRLNKRIERYLSMGSCIWLTLTFSPDTLSKTTQETRKRYVARFLKSQSDYYVANIDYGKENEREHYHAVVVGDFVDMSKWSYGFALTERIKNHKNTPKKLSKYVSKLTNHAIKITTKRSCYIYSRSF